MDEVQTGFGRLGTHYWGFEYHGVRPDIITAAKSECQRKLALIIILLSFISVENQHSGVYVGRTCRIFELDVLIP